MTGPDGPSVAGRISSSFSLTPCWGRRGRRFKSGHRDQRTAGHTVSSGLRFVFPSVDVRIREQGGSRSRPSRAGWACSRWTSCPGAHDDVTDEGNLVRVRDGPEAVAGDDHPAEVRPWTRAAARRDIRQRHRDLVVVLIGLRAARAGAVVVSSAAGDGRGVIPVGPPHARQGRAAVHEDVEDGGPDLREIPGRSGTAAQVIQDRQRGRQGGGRGLDRPVRAVPALGQRCGVVGVPDGGARGRRGAATRALPCVLPRRAWSSRACRMARAGRRGRI